MKAALATNSPATDGFALLRHLDLANEPFQPLKRACRASQRAVGAFATDYNVLQYKPI